MVRLVRFGLLIVAGSSIWAAGRSHATPAAVTPAQGQAALSRLPLRFEANQGQRSSGIRFSARASGFNLSLTNSGPVMTFANSARLEMSLAGGNQAPVIEGQDPFRARTNYFIGSRDRWQTGIANYARVRYRSVYPGIDVVYYGAGNHLEYDFVLAPGADPDAIRIEFEGARGLHLSPQGDLSVDTAAGAMLQPKPVIYQADPRTGERRLVSGRYVMLGDNTIGLRLDRYDRKQQLVIDPYIIYSTYMGGAVADQINAVALSHDGLLYMVGQTANGDLPYIDGAYDNFNFGLTDVFIAIVDTTAKGNFALVYFSYIGGSNIDIPTCLAVDSNDIAYVGGTTTSTDFPMAGNSYLSTGAATYITSFIFQLNPQLYGGNSLLYSTFLGGTTGADTIAGLALDSKGNIYVIGTAASTDFPVTSDAFAGSRYGNNDAFITELNPNSTDLIYSTYIGGEYDEDGRAIAVTAPGVIYFAINTQSPDFPTAGPQYHASLGGASDLAVGTMNLNLASTDGLTYATFFGGTDVDEVRGMTVDPKGNMVLTGYTLSTDFPVTGDAVQSVSNGNGDAFLSILNPAKSGLVVYSTYLGGSDADVGYAVAADSLGGYYVTGYTMSGDFPVANAIQSTWGQGVDIFIAKVTPSISGRAGLTYSTYIGDANINVGYALAARADGTLYVAGSTEGLLPIWPNPSQGSYGGGASDGFLMVIGN